MDAFLAGFDMTRDQVDSWIMHPGGPKIMEAAAAALGLHNGELELSWEALRKVGNLSSASVLVVSGRGDDAPQA